MRRLVLIVGLLLSSAAAPGPYLPAGDIMLRNDIQRLADYGVITGPITTWPLVWGPILADLNAYADVASLPPDVSTALHRLRSRARLEARSREVRWSAELAVGDNSRVIRSFQDTPREDFEAAAGVSWFGERLSLDLSATIVSSPADGEDVRADGSAISLALGNFTLGLSAQDRWWGPGWDGSLILSNNARPVPAVTLDRNFTDPFESRWLRWIGPWDLTVMMGQLEEDRYVPDALLFGMRFSFRPLRSLEIGLSRTAQWCGEDRPCDLETFIDLLLGNDNVGSSGVNPENEPGNQLAGIDWRWAGRPLGRPVAIYGQLTGEDEAGGLPSRYLGLLGIETTGTWGDRWSYRWYGEFAGTSCSFYKSQELFDCAYTHGIYQTGYRYRGRAIGHGLDADARVLTAGLVLVDDADRMLHVLGRYGALNRGTLPDPNHTLAELRREISSLDLGYRRSLARGALELGAGAERLEDESTGDSQTDVRLFVRWQQFF
jgi:hypothetical protein